MAEPTIQLGGGNWAGKTDNLLGYYKEGERFYKQDFTFSRSTTGTYTDSDGYIQEMPYNLLTYSEDFSQWSLNTSGISSIEANYAASPEGLQNAYKVNFIVQSDSDLSLSQTHTITGGSTYVYSIYIKGEGTNIGKDVVIKSKRQGGGDSAGTTTTQTLTNEWKRINFTTTYAANNINGRLLISSNDATSCLVYGAQAEEGTSAKTYFPTTTRLNMPRVDYLNNTNGSLILEPQRSNLVTYSSDFTEWSTIGSPTLTSNYGQSPDGLNNSTRVQFSSGDRIYISASLSGDISYSVYLKGNGTVRMRDNSGAYSNDVTLTNEWVRYDYTFNASISNVQLQQSSGTSDFEIYGAQVESGSYATTLINTSGSSVTRNADACTDGGDASRFNDSEGVLFFEGSTLVESGITRVISISDGSTSNNIYFNFNQNSNSFNCQVLSSGSNQFNPSVTMTKINNNKIALKYKENDFALWINGTEVATDTSGITPIGLDRLNFDFGQGSFDFEGKVKQIQYYNTALSDSELATLTTL